MPVIKFWIKTGLNNREAKILQWLERVSAVCSSPRAAAWSHSPCLTVISFPFALSILPELSLNQFSSSWGWWNCGVTCSGWGGGDLVLHPVEEETQLRNKLFMGTLTAGVMGLWCFTASTHSTLFKKKKRQTNIQCCIFTTQMQNTGQ